VELKPRELALAVQTELKRVGCYPGSIDGVWCGRSREALAVFGPKVGVAELAPTPQILALIKGKSDAVCLASGEGHPPVGEGAPPPEHAPAHHGGGY
jgi:hypothetical protein